MIYCPCTNNLFILNRETARGAEEHIVAKGQDRPINYTDDDQSIDLQPSGGEPAKPVGVGIPTSLIYSTRLHRKQESETPRGQIVKLRQELLQ
ncbi:hypothetical protein ScPMuIL_008434 [Solemya velum]